MKKLPIGIQVFKEIRDVNENYIYVDKTKEAFHLIKGQKYNFLSRPRRFGKTLFTDTLAEIFLANKKLFKGLYIYDKWSWNIKYPVIRIDFMTGNFSSIKNIETRIKKILLKNAENYHVTVENDEIPDIGTMLEQLIFEIHKKYQQKVVILIDEYDKPILNNITKNNNKMAIKARNTLRTLYSALKANDRYLRFVFLTGVSKFSKLNLFSDLNNIVDISINPKYGNITGYTQSELEKNFDEHLKNVNLEDLKKWYNGYYYFKDHIYNPFDILLFLSENKTFRNFWWETGNPAFLIEKLKNENFHLQNIENIEVGLETLNSFDEEHIEPIALLWQTGYLTFKNTTNRAGRQFYTMKIPNLEIQNSLNELFLNYLISKRTETNSFQAKIFDALHKFDFETLENELKCFFHKIPYQTYVKNNIANFEGYYSAVMFTFFSSLGHKAIPEDSTNTGRIDLTLIANNATYIFEFKVDKTAKKALMQIKEKKYYQKYTNRKLPIYIIGIQFDSNKKEIENIEWELISS